jgi:hypothetical protein
MGPAPLNRTGVGWVHWILTGWVRWILTGWVRWTDIG